MEEFVEHWMMLHSYSELFDFGLNVTLGEMLDVGQLEVHLSEPHQDAVPRRLKLLPLADEMLHKHIQW